MNFCNESNPKISIPSTSDASTTFSLGRKTFLNPFSFAAFVMGRIPFIGLISPFRASSPITIASSSLSKETWFEAARSAMAIGKSKFEPCFFNSAGARFTVFFSMGYLSPLFLMAERTLSLDSWTEMSPSPTILNEESPREISASTSMRSQLSPVAVIDWIFAGMMGELKTPLCLGDLTENLIFP